MNTAQQTHFTDMPSPNDAVSYHTAQQTHFIDMPSPNDAVSYHYENTVNAETEISVSTGDFYIDFIDDIDTNKKRDSQIDTGLPANTSSPANTGSLIFGDISGAVKEKHSISRLQTIDKHLQLLSEIKENSGDQGFKAPSETTLTNAREIMKHLLERLDYEQCPWPEPFTYSDEFSYVSMEWHQENRALHFDIKEDDMQYTRIWGRKDNIESETSNLSIHNCLSLWKWLIINEQS